MGKGRTVFGNIFCFFPDSKGAWFTRFPNKNKKKVKLIVQNASGTQGTDNSVWLSNPGEKRFLKMNLALSVLSHLIKIKQI